MRHNKKIIYYYYITILILFFWLLSLEAEPVSDLPFSFSGADDGFINITIGEVFIRGKDNIKWEFENNTIYAQEFHYNKDTGDVTFLGNVLYNDGIHKIYAEKCIYNIKDNAGVLYKAGSEDKPIIFDSENLRIVNKKTYLMNL